MSSKTISYDSFHSLRVHRYVVAPYTLTEWVIWMIVWGTALLVSSIFFGVILNQPQNGASAGIFLSGMCVIFATDTYSKKGGAD